MSILFDHISFSHGKQRVIQDIHLEIQPGNFYSLIGPNGSGKTTLLDLVTGFFKPDTGKILINGMDLGKIPKLKAAREIALVAQNDNINFPFSVEEILMMGRHPYIPRFSNPAQADFDMIDQVISECGINHLRSRKINELSGGEAQRCLFARALCQDTPVMLLDEAFSNMDIRHTLRLLDLVRTAVQEKKKTVISVFHDLNLACSWSDQILMLKNGKITAAGSPETVMTPQHIQDVFGVAAVVDTSPHTGRTQVHYPNAATY